MTLSVLVFFCFGSGALALVCARSWHTAVVLALVEAAWVALCGAYASLLIETGDLFFLFWACLMLFFSAVELVLSATLFAFTKDASAGDFPAIQQPDKVRSK